MEQVIEILLVEDDKNMCEAFEYCIRGKKQFHLAAQTGKQSEGLELLRVGKMGAVILDLELDEGDGINFLYEMKELDIERPVVIVITNNRSEVIRACLKANGVEFICPKYNEDYSPEKVLSIIELLYPFRAKVMSPQMKVISYQQSQEKIYQRNRIEEELAVLGFKTNNKTIRYLIDVIQYVAYETKNPECEMKEVYSAVAKKNKTKAVNVEKALRDNIERTWTRSKPEVLERYYPFPISKDSGTPTNMEFVKNMARKIQKHG